MNRTGCLWVPSTNFDVRPGRRIRCIVIHSTAGSLKLAINELTNPENKKSAHYVIGKNGSINQLVSDRDVAWHAGISSWRGREWVNGFSIGIELENANDGKDPYPEMQVAACAWLCRQLMQENNVGIQDVVGHADVSPGRKTDPLGFPWEAFRKVLNQL